MGMSFRGKGVNPSYTPPFLANRHSAIGQAHPEYFVQKNGAPYSPWADKNCDPPWGDRLYLDPTHPAVQEHIAALYRKLYDWGFRYFKTDFLSNPIMNGYANHSPDRDGTLAFHQRGQGLIRSHRRCMQQIRASIGDESFWLGCGSIWATGAGLMDASRTGSDIQASWQTTRDCALSVQWAGALHGQIWLNDPDFLIVRGPETSNALMAAGDGADTFVMASHGNAPDFTANEAQVWATCVAMSGGHVVLSDSICALNERGLAIIQTILPLSGGPAAEPIDVNQQRPGILLKQNADSPTLACINWSDDRKVAVGQAWLAHLPDRSWHDAWTGQTYHTSDLARLKIAAHSCLLLH